MRKAQRRSNYEKGIRTIERPSSPAPLLDNPLENHQYESFNQDPELRWYWAHDSGGFLMPYKKYRNEPIHNTPLSYLWWCETYEYDPVLYPEMSPKFYVKDDVKIAIRNFKNGLRSWLQQGNYGKLSVPLGKVYKGKKIEECYDKDWMRWLLRKSHMFSDAYKARHEMFFFAIRGWLANPRHQNAKRDIGELLSETEYTDDLDLEYEAEQAQPRNPVQAEFVDLDDFIVYDDLEENDHKTYEPPAESEAESDDEDTSEGEADSLDLGWSLRSSPANTGSAEASEEEESDDSAMEVEDEGQVTPPPQSSPPPGVNDSPARKLRSGHMYLMVDNETERGVAKQEYMPVDLMELSDAEEQQAEGEEVHGGDEENEEDEDEKDGSYERGQEHMPIDFSDLIDAEEQQTEGEEVNGGDEEDEDEKNKSDERGQEYMPIDFSDLIDSQEQQIEGQEVIVGDEENEEDEDEKDGSHEQGQEHMPIDFSDLNDAEEQRTVGEEVNGGDGEDGEDEDEEDGSDERGREEAGLDEVQSISSLGPTREDTPMEEDVPESAMTSSVEDTLPANQYSRRLRSGRVVVLEGERRDTWSRSQNTECPDNSKASRHSRALRSGRIVVFDDDQGTKSSNQDATRSAEEALPVRRSRRNISPAKRKRSA